MEIRLGPAGIPIGCKCSSTAEGVEYVRRIGLSAMEVEFVRGVNMGAEMAKKVGIAAEKNDVELSVHAPYYINLCNPEKRKDSEKRILDSCQRAHEMGAQVVVFHPGYYSKLGKREAFEMVMESCFEMGEWIKKKNFSNVFLGLETTGKKSQFGDLDEIMEICKNNENCRPVIDFAHLYARNAGKVDYEDAINTIRKIKCDCYHSHFSGIEFTTAGERRHLPMSGAKPDFSEIAKILVEKKVSITIISESPLLEEDSLLMKNMLENLGVAFK